ncbi:aldehyde dehydrogenase family protein [Streptomyces sp. NPDC048425]|uniref:aldehyde dehydrogenase family protein n=1 Tax=Streptomyces sp. NPDC048425 TaxID=3365548 RepID=UPI00371E343F
MVVDADLRVPQPDALLIGGEWRPSDGGALTPVISPSTEEVVAEVVMPSVRDAEAAAAAAAEGYQGDWPRWAVGLRKEVCARFCERMEERLDEIGNVWAVEAGMTVRWSRTLHRFAAATAWRGALDAVEQTLAPEIRSTPVGEVRIEHAPGGPVLAIMPYNGPLATIGSKVVPALLAGTSVVVKAAPESALMLRIVAECAAEAGFPPGVVSFLAGDVEVSRHLVRDPRLEMISFTGGTKAASDILCQSAAHMPRTVFELGGKSPAVLLEDVDLDQALRSLVAGAMSGSGQVCAALSRILVPASRHDEIVAVLADAYRSLRIGLPRSKDTDHGPLSNRTSLERTEGFVETALSEGASVVCGGRRPEAFPKGYFYEPTLLTTVDENSTVAQEEVFGPVTAVLTYDRVDDAIRIANGTEYGLAASVYSADRGKALEVARQIRAGSVALNTFGPTMAAPFGGVKRSGWGRECGPEGIREFSETKQVLLG